MLAKKMNRKKKKEEQFIRVLRKTVDSIHERTGESKYSIVKKLAKSTCHELDLMIILDKLYPEDWAPEVLGVPL